MSSIGKIKKNAEKYRLEQFCRQMTPEQYKQALTTAVRTATENLALEYDRNLNKMKEETNKKIDSIVNVAINMTSVEFLYEIGRQLDCYIDKPENMEQKIDLVQEIGENVAKIIQNYDKKEFDKKRKQVEKIFKIKF